MLVCDSCGHVAAHDSGPGVTVPRQVRGGVAFIVPPPVLFECGNADCFCNLPVWRTLLPTEPAL